jgi:hypothetical protein
MKSIHAIADPHLRVELSSYGQYCGPTKPPTKRGTKKCEKGRGAKKRRRVSDDRDYFDEYCGSVFSDWDSCKKLAATLINAPDDELAANIEAYRDADREDDLYGPFQYLANRALELARQDLVNQSASSSAVSNQTPDLLNLAAVPTYNRPILGCVGDRKQVCTALSKFVANMS